MSDKEKAIDDVKDGGTSENKKKFTEPKLKFIEPKLDKMGSVEEITAGFFGTFYP